MLHSVQVGDVTRLYRVAVQVSHGVLIKRLRLLSKFALTHASNRRQSVRRENGDAVPGKAKKCRKFGGQSTKTEM